MSIPPRLWTWNVLISDEGGICSFFLLIERMGNVYDKLPDGTPLLPFFQTNKQPALKFSGGEDHPPYSPVPEPWLTVEGGTTQSMIVKTLLRVESFQDFQLQSIKTPLETQAR